ncbi:MAG: NADP-dependent isocitrate dehydrogenase, partial [Pseudomonadota bacterium]
TDDVELQARFTPVAAAMQDKETTIVNELNAVQGAPVDVGGYYRPNDEKAAAAMRPSATLNGILTSLN